MGKSSIAFLTGSVVVPKTSETTERFCPVTAFTRLDFPALRIPKKPICTLSAETVSFKLTFITLFHNLKSEITSVGILNIIYIALCNISDFVLGYFL